MALNADSTLHAILIAAPQQFNARAINALDRQIDEAIAQHIPSLDFDMLAVESVDSAALNWLLDTQKRLTASNISLRLINVNPLGQDILISTRLDSRFTWNLSPVDGEPHG
jgi:anti-anti-sigma factor